MAKKGFLYEVQISAKDNDALNRFATATVDIDGGTLVSLGAVNDDVFTATKATAGTGGGLWMAYNPEEHLTKVGDNLFAGLTADPRDYTNIANRTFDVFKPVAGVDIVGFTDGNLKAGETPTVGDFLEVGADGLEVQSSATADTTSFEVIKIEKVPFPQAGIGAEYANKYVCAVAFN